MTRHIKKRNPLLFQAGTISPTGKITPTIISSTPAREQFDKNVDFLTKEEAVIGGAGKLETPLAVPPVVTEGEVPPPKEVPKRKTPEVPLAITATSANLAFQKIIDDTNKLLEDFKTQGGELTPEMQDRVSRIEGLEVRKDIALADARIATDEGDPEAQAVAVEEVKVAEREEKSEIQLFRDEIDELRRQFVAGLAPSERNIELRRELQELRTERQLMPLELRKEGIPAAGIAGRIVEDERVRAIQEGNLLFELGLEAEQKRFEQASVEAQLKFIQDDVDLQFKIQDKLQEDEDRIVEQARDQRKEALDFMNTVVDEDALGGLSWEDLDAQTQSDLIRQAEDVGLDLSLLQDAMKNVKQQQVFDKSVKERIREVAEARERRLRKEVEEDEEIPQTFEEFINESGIEFPALTPEVLKRLQRAYDEEIAKEEVKAKDFFSNAKLAEGARKAKISITEFGNLSVDEANQHFGKKKKTTKRDDEEREP